MPGERAVISFISSEHSSSFFSIASLVRKFIANLVRGPFQREGVKIDVAIGEDVVPKEGSKVKM